jgi:ketosteroid isomerase-like protein
MNRALFIAALGAVLLGLAFGWVESKESKSAGDEATEQIVHLEEELAEAAIRRDAAMYDRLMADDFIGVDHGGQALTKVQVLDRLNVSGYELDSLRHENIRVRIYGDCAVVLARTVLKGHYQGQEVGGEFPYLRVWIRQQGRWQAVATQSTRLPQL